MKIFQVITRSELGGAQSVLINLSNSLQKDNEVFVIAGGNGEMWKLLDNGIKRIPLKQLKRNISPILDLLVLVRLIILYFKYKPDVLHLHSSKIGILGRLAFPPKKIIYTVHGFDSIRIGYRKFLPFEKVLKNRVKAIVAVSEYDRKNLISEGINNNVYTIYNGINNASNKLSANTPFSNNKKIILCIARIEPPKRFELFVDIAKLLPQYNFLWIGNRSLKENLPANVKCLGEIPSASDYYAISDLCILPSDYEGLPITIIEAMSYGKPVVASNVGGISEIISNNKNGYTVENDVVLFVNKISYILENIDVYEHFSNASFQRFKEILTIDKMVEGYKKIYCK